MKLWKGIEREGKYKNTYTLFIGSPEITYSQIEHFLHKDKENRIKQLYFGAGKCTEIDYEVVDLCLQYFKQLITLEVEFNDVNNIPKHIAKECEIIVTINNDKLSYIKTMDTLGLQIKIQSLNLNPSMLIISDIKEFQEVDTSVLNNKVYEGDEVLL